MSDTAVDPYASAGAGAGDDAVANPYAGNDSGDIDGTPPPQADGAEVKKTPVAQFVSSATSKETWTTVAAQTKVGVQKAAHATAKTAKHLTQGKTWVDKEEVSFGLRDVVC